MRRVVMVLAAANVYACGGIEAGDLSLQGTGSSGFNSNEIPSNGGLLGSREVNANGLTKVGTLGGLQCAEPINDHETYKLDVAPSSPSDLTGPLNVVVSKAGAELENVEVQLWYTLGDIPDGVSQALVFLAPFPDLGPWTVRAFLPLRGGPIELEMVCTTPQALAPVQMSSLGA